MNIRLYYSIFLLFFVFIQKNNCIAQRVPVLQQVDLPHNYYFREMYLPQLTSGPSAVCWLPDGKTLVYSMGGSLWMQQKAGDTAIQLTDGDGYDYQPDCSPDGSNIIFVRYNGRSVELMLLQITTGKIIQLTDNKAVNLEPRWSPDGKRIAFVSTMHTGHFLLYAASIENNKLVTIQCITPERKSTVKRYYYSASDHAINPVWSKDGKDIIYISNKEIPHGTGDIVAKQLNGDSTINIIRHEETSWRTKPDISPDGTRMVYSSYHGGNWHQLWILPAKGGYSIPITYGDFDNTAPRWSPTGKEIAFISNRTGNTSMWIVNAFDGGQVQITANQLLYRRPHKKLIIQTLGENNKPVAARISITGTNEKFYAPANAWIQADDCVYPATNQYESHYFHASGQSAVHVPEDSITIRVSHGPMYETVQLKIDAKQLNGSTIEIQLKKLPLPAGAGNWYSGDVHVHMNYGGHYRNTPAMLLQQAQSEDVNIAYNLVVNKEQRMPDMQYFQLTPDAVSTGNNIILYGQEFHTSFWGHLGLLNLKDHFILPDYAGYPQTAVASLYPHNSFIADRAHDQNGIVGYVHPFEQSEIFPEQSSTLVNELPIDAALGKVDYYELAGFSDHKASEAVWYQLLNCGLRIPAAAGTDVMANYASLRGPVGLTRVYVNAPGPLDKDLFLQNMRKGNSFVTNGPIIGFTVENAAPGDSIFIQPNGQALSYKAFLRSNYPVKHFEVIWNGKIIATHVLKDDQRIADAEGKIDIKGPGWLLLRAWSEDANPDLPDLYPYASTNPVFVYDGRQETKSKSAGTYFLQWLNRIETVIDSNTSFRTEEEKKEILTDIHTAKAFFNTCIKEATIP